jgi:hypothetical protein
LTLKAVEEDNFMLYIGEPIFGTNIYFDPAAEFFVFLKIYSELSEEQFDFVSVSILRVYTKKVYFFG